MTALLLLALLALLACDQDPPANPDTGGDGGGTDDTGPTVIEEECDAPLSCVPVVELACAGPETPLAPVPGPTACPDHTVTDDAPATFPVGTTTVTFTDTETGETCTTEVVVADAGAPTVACPEAIVLASGDGLPQPIPLDGFQASDACAPGEEAAVLSAETADLGSTELTYTATDPSGNEATCSTTVQVLDLAAPDGLQVLGAELLDDGTTSVGLGWTGGPGADATYVEVQLAEAEEGPWTTVAAASAPMVDGIILDGAAAWARVVAVADGLEGGASAPLRLHAIQGDTYHVEEVELPGIDFATSLYGVVRAPADLDGGPYPLILLIHGNHGNCRATDTSSDVCVTVETHSCDYSGYEPTPNAEGMAFQAETLAAQGYVAVSISANALNCRNTYIEERAWLLRGHLDQWAQWNAEPGGPYEGAVDLLRVGLVGHSRGGDAVGYAPGLLAANPIEGVAIASVFAIAPTDYEDTTVGPTPYLALLPACDGDVTTLSGRDVYDRSSIEVDGAVRAQAFMLGANHNYFSTEWAYNDGYSVCDAGELLTARAQQGWLEATESAWFRATLDGAAHRADVLAEADTPECVLDWAASDLDVRWSHSAAARTIIDDFLGEGAPATNRLGLANTQEGFARAQTCTGNACGRDFDHLRTALDLLTDPKATGTARFELGGLDASAARALSFRAVSAASGVNAARAEHDPAVVVTDTAGASATLRLSDLLGPLPHLYPAADQRELLQTVRVPLARLVEVEPALDTGALASLALVFDEAAPGQVRITDVELAE